MEMEAKGTKTVGSCKYLFSRRLKKSASFVLASLRGSTYRSVRLASALAAAALDGHFEHPASRSHDSRDYRVR
jgi:hypothetical protein